MNHISTVDGKVAAVIDNTTLVLNVGQQHGVHEGMLFSVVTAQQQITDPDSGERLGRWEAVKGRVVVTHVQPRLCTVRSLVLAQIHGSGTLSEMMVRHSFGLYGDRAQGDQRAPLDVVRASISGRPRLQPITVGDVVHSIALDKLAAVPPGASGGEDLPSQAYATQHAGGEHGDGGSDVAPAAAPVVTSGAEIVAGTPTPDA